MLFHSEHFQKYITAGVMYTLYSALNSFRKYIDFDWIAEWDDIFVTILGAGPDPPLGRRPRFQLPRGQVQNEPDLDM